MKPVEKVIAQSLMGDRGNIIVVNLKYPYGKSQTFMPNPSLFLAGRLQSTGHNVWHIDLNLSFPKLNPFKSKEYMVFGKYDEFTQSIFGWETVCISVLGAPYIPGAIALARHIRFWQPKVNLIVGGQGVESLEYSEFDILFQGTGAFQIKNDTDLNCALGTQVGIPGAFSITLKSALVELTTEQLKQYISHEMCLFISQGCKYNCKFCAAEKNRAETFRDMGCFKTDLKFLAEKAKEFGLTTLNFYASSLDFFQNPREIEKFLLIIADIRKKTGIDIRVRCLSCMKSFLFASTRIENFGQKLQDAGLWSVGFGVDGTDETIWKAQGKTQNSTHHIIECLELAAQIGITSELLMIFGFSEDTPKTLWKNLKSSFRYVRHYKNTVLRPYLAKEVVPGNEEWRTRKDVVAVILKNPELFYNLDFCAIGSRLTHPHWRHRFISNATYLTMIALFTPFGRCLTSPLLPQGSWGFIGKLFNRFIPFDR